ncbi:MAG: hypothetical protein MUF34_31450 [Polyangiaceae bacterium]|jgi:hypothetical protein|nr:hypothetical protein [Polyangiaceae bacterium]
MSLRSYTALSLVVLPRLSAADAVALGARLVAAARAQTGLPAPIGKALGRFEASLGTLREARRVLRELQSVDPRVAAAADVRLDAGWAGFHSFLQGWARLPVPGKVDAQVAWARRLLDDVYPEGLGFTQARYVIEWAESQKRLDRLAEPETAWFVASLGGEAFVEAIRDAFDAYGEALHMTTSRAEIKATLTLREPLEEVTAMLRKYVLLVTSFAEADDDAEASALAEALLGPLVAWETAAVSKGKGGPVEEPAPEPAPPSV